MGKTGPELSESPGLRLTIASSNEWVREFVICRNYIAPMRDGRRDSLSDAMTASGTADRERPDTVCSDARLTAWMLGGAAVEADGLASLCVEKPIALLDAYTGESLLGESDWLVLPGAAEGHVDTDTVGLNVIAPMSILNDEASARSIAAEGLLLGEAKPGRFRDVVLIVDDSQSCSLLGAHRESPVARLLSRLRRAVEVDSQEEWWLECDRLLDALDGEHQDVFRGLICAHAERLSARVGICSLRDSKERRAILEPLLSLGFDRLANRARRAAQPDADQIELFPQATSPDDVPARLAYRFMQAYARPVVVASTQPLARTAAKRRLINVSAGRAEVSVLVQGATPSAVRLSVTQYVQGNSVVVDVTPDWDIRISFGVAGLCGAGEQRVWVEAIDDWISPSPRGADVQIGATGRFVFQLNGRRKHSITLGFAPDARTYGTQKVRLPIA